MTISEPETAVISPAEMAFNLDIARRVLEERNPAQADSEPYTRPGSMKVKYWKRPMKGSSKGYIKVGPYFDSDMYRHRRWQKKGFIELPDSFGVSVAGAEGDTMQGYDKGRNGIRELDMFLTNGGLTAKDDQLRYLLPKEQILELGMHHLQTVREARPDVAEHVDFHCPEGCINDVTGELRWFATIYAQRQHMVAVHDKTSGQRAMGEQISESNAALMEKMSERLAPAISGGLSAEAMQAIITAAVAAAVAAVQGTQAPSQIVDLSEPIQHTESASTTPWTQLNSASAATGTTGSMNQVEFTPPKRTSDLPRSERPSYRAEKDARRIALTTGLGVADGEMPNFGALTRQQCMRFAKMNSYGTSAVDFKNDTAWWQRFVTAMWKKQHPSADESSVAPEEGAGS